MPVITGDLKLENLLSLEDKMKSSNIITKQPKGGISHGQRQWWKMI